MPRFTPRFPWRKATVLFVMLVTGLVVLYAWWSNAFPFSLLSTNQGKSVNIVGVTFNRKVSRFAAEVTLIRNGLRYDRQNVVEYPQNRDCLVKIDKDRVQEDSDALSLIGKAGFFSFADFDDRKFFETVYEEGVQIGVTSYASDDEIASYQKKYPQVRIMCGEVPPPLLEFLTVYVPAGKESHWVERLLAQKEVKMASPRYPPGRLPCFSTSRMLGFGP